MSIDIEVSRHLAEIFAIAAAALAMLVLMWVISFFCKIIEGEKLDWMTKFLLVGAWLLSFFGMAGVYYLGVGHFGVMVYVVYAIVAVVSIWLTFYTLLKSVHPLSQQT